MNNFSQNQKLKLLKHVRAGDYHVNQTKKNNPSFLDLGKIYKRIYKVKLANKFKMGSLSKVKVLGEKYFYESAQVACLGVTRRGRDCIFI